VFDTIGIGLFTILGLLKTLDAGLSPVIAVLMGMVSATFGGVLRDVLSNVVPLIFRREISNFPTRFAPEMLSPSSSSASMPEVSMTVD